MSLRHLGDSSYRFVIGTHLDFLEVEDLIVGFDWIDLITILTFANILLDVLKGLFHSVGLPSLFHDLPLPAYLDMLAQIPQILFLGLIVLNWLLVVANVDHTLGTE